ncbi:hypothetical protein SAMN05216198_1069 [Halopseudomonas litoralis]|uniref:Leucyl-tRNA synthetase n=1 Tax=Halopseudomonas litoralis TaxID=797277 RepID=A0A1H1P1V6_9GAMM|nr:hypothetical protein [Halopseudomonas litoralis]SDS05184.1 hypothetical protein SAMN05216198_1069 [Halopseudomonas litoralis]
MAKAKSDIELDDEDFVADEDEASETETSTSKASLTRRRQIDNLLEERRLQKQLSEYDFDLD